MRRLMFVVGIVALVAWCPPIAFAGQHGHHGGSGHHGGGQQARPSNPPQNSGSGGQHAVPRTADRERGRYDGYRYHNGGSRSYGPRRFPRSYGFSRFYGYRYGDSWLRPHYRYWNGFSWFYWPWYDAPRYGCGWYWLPTHRSPVPPDGDEGEQWWEYDDWGWVYVCTD